MAGLLQTGAQTGTPAKVYNEAKSWNSARLLYALATTSHDVLGPAAPPTWLSFADIEKTPQTGRLVLYKAVVAQHWHALRYASENPIN